MYEAARQRNPERWTGVTRNWNPVTEVWLNPPQEKKDGERAETQSSMISERDNYVDKHRFRFYLWLGEVDFFGFSKPNSTIAFEISSVRSGPIDLAKVPVIWC